LVIGTGCCSWSRMSGKRNLVEPNIGLRGVPVGTWLSAKALGAKGESPCFSASAPVTVKRPHRWRSRRVIWSRDSALTISARLSRARCASR